MTHMISQMNAVLSDWRERYDPFHQMSLSFQQTDRGEVSLEQYRVRLAPDLVLREARYDAKSILFAFDNNRNLEILLRWPEEETPYINHIFWH